MSVENSKIELLKSSENRPAINDCALQVKLYGLYI